jgi:antitoxin component of MazEF toxin-antitoxin module
MVIVVVEPGAVAEAVRVTVAEQVGVQLAGENALAVTPVGRTVVMLNVTALGTPATRVADAVSTPPTPPPVIDKEAGVAATLKSNGAAVTTRLKVAERVSTPATAWIVIVVVELGAVADAVNVTVAEHVGLQLAGENALAVTPVGSTVAMLKVTAVVTPARRVADAVSTPPTPPPVMERVAGVAARLKSKPAGVTTRVNVAVRVRAPAAAWIVIVVVEPGAVAEAVRVTVAEQVGLQLAGVKALSVTPVGRTVVILNVTALGTPATSVADAVSTPPTPPPVIDKEAGVAATLKSNGAAVTTRLKVAVRVSRPATP